MFLHLFSVHPFAAFVAASFRMSLLTSGAALLAAVCWGGGDFSGGLATKSTSPLRVIALAHGLDVLLLGAWLLLSHGGAPTREALIWGTASGLVNGVALSCFYLALASGAMGISAAIAGLLTAAIPVAVESSTRGMPGPLVLSGFALAFVAIVLLTRGEEAQGGSSRRAVVLSLIAGTGFGLFLVFSRLGSHQQLVWPLLLSRAGSTAVALGGMAAVALRSTPEKRPRLSRQAFGLAMLAGVLDAAGNLAFMWAARAGRLDIAAVLASLYPAATIALAILVLRERLSRTQGVGVAVTLAAVALISIGQ